MGWLNFLWRFKAWLLALLGGLVIMVMRWRHEAAQMKAWQAEQKAADLQMRLRTREARQKAMEDVEKKYGKESEANRKAKQQGKRRGGLPKW